MRIQLKNTIYLKGEVEDSNRPGIIITVKIHQFKDILHKYVIRQVYMYIDAWLDYNLEGVQYMLAVYARYAAWYIQVRVLNSLNIW